MTIARKPPFPRGEFAYRVGALLKVVAIIAVLWFLLWLIMPARAHEWLPDECCHGQDCYEAVLGEVSFVLGGYHIMPDDIVIPFGDARLRYSNPTPVFFICRNYKKMTNAPKCLFPPQPGS